MPKKTTFGTLLNNFRFQRQEARRKAQSDLWNRNGLDNPSKREGYKIESVVIPGKDGSEVTAFELWKKVDEAAIIIDTEVTVADIEKPKAESTLGDLLNG